MARLLLVVLALLAAVAAAAAQTTHLADAPGSNLVLHGASNVAPWRCIAATLEARADVAAPLAHINAVIDRIEDGNVGVWMANKSEGRFPQPTFELRLPIDRLRCGNGRMERDLQRALRAEAHPMIVFRFLDLVGGLTHDIDGGSYHATVTGRLSLAGRSRDVDVRIEARRLARDRFRLRATLPLRMTDFDVTPPTALFGAIKAKDDLTVQFDLLLAASEDRP